MTVQSCKLHRISVANSGTSTVCRGVAPEAASSERFVRRAQKRPTKRWLRDAERTRPALSAIVERAPSAGRLTALSIAVYALRCCWCQCARGTASLLCSNSHSFGCVLETGARRAHVNPTRECWRVNSMEAQIAKFREHQLNPELSNDRGMVSCVWMRCASDRFFGFYYSCLFAEYALWRCQMGRWVQCGHRSRLACGKRAPGKEGASAACVRVDVRVANTVHIIAASCQRVFCTSARRAR